jgi:DNA invertase Pin-like site-specific DNA recombinase
MQIREIQHRGERRGWESIHEYTDRGVSGAKESLPVQNRFRTDAHKRRFDAIVVGRIDRFARSTSHLLKTLVIFGSLGIEFVSLCENVDASTAT